MDLLKVIKINYERKWFLFSFLYFNSEVGDIRKYLTKNWDIELSSIFSHLLISQIVDVLESLPGKLKHVALQTGTKHYFGSFDDMAERFQNPNIAEELSVPFKAGGLTSQLYPSIRANFEYNGG